LVSHCFGDTRKGSEAHLKQLEEFGDIREREFYETMKLISPYHLCAKQEHLFETDLLLTADSDFPLIYHPRKMAAKLREVFRPPVLDDRDEHREFIFYREFPSQMYSSAVKKSIVNSFLINGCLFR
jgi:hypothetical protein